MNITSFRQSLRRWRLAKHVVILATVVSAAAPALGVELQYDQEGSDKAQTVRSLEAQTRMCMNSGIRGALRQGQRDSEGLINFAVQACGNGLQRMLMSGFATKPMSAESSMAYLRGLANLELSRIPGITNAQPGQDRNVNEAVPAAGAPRTKTDMANELAQAPKSAIATIRKSGISGLTKQIGDCYRPNGKSNEQLIKCVYLDIAARYIDQIAVEALNASPNPFFQDSKFGMRIGPVLRGLNMDLEGSNRYLRTVSAAIRKITDDELDEHPL